MSGKQFVHLHNHSDHSLLDGYGSVQRMVESATRFNNPALGLSDHGTPGGLVRLFKHCSEAGINAIPGIEFYRADDRWSKSKTSRGKQNFHLPVWAVSNKGYKNLIKLSSEAAHSMYGKFPRIDDDLLDGNTEGLVASTGCLGSEVLQELLHDNYRGAREAAAKHKDLFEYYFLELQEHGIEEQQRILPDMIRLSKELDIPLLATNDIHYPDKSDAHTHDALLCCQTGTKIADENRFRFTSPDQHYFKSPEEMYELFPESEFPGACSNTLLIAEMAEDISVDLDSDNYLLPQFEVPEGFRNSDEYLRHTTEVGLKSRLGSQAEKEEYQERKDYELGVISGMGFSDYILMVGDYIGHAKNSGILVGPGRGSSAGSLVAYANSITDLDPISHGLLFERFLNPDRISMPDIDTDFDPDGRSRLIEYLMSKYGDDRVAHIATWSSYKGRSAVRTASRVLGRTGPQQNFLALGYPELPQTTSPPPLKEILNEDTDDDSIRELQNTLFAPLLNRVDYQQDPDGTGDVRPQAKSYHGLSKEEVRETYALAAKIEGNISARGTHACGFLITPTPLTDNFPLVRLPRKKDDSPLDFMVDLDAPDVESLGGIKFDILGLINLKVVDRALSLVRERHGINVDLDSLALDDPKTYELLTRGDTSGVFQLESDGMKELLARLRPREFSDIAAVLALYRPGPMGSNFHTAFADRRNGREALEAPHPEMLELLKETSGLPVYQESIMLLSRHFAGFSPGEADTFRKAIGKKKLDVLEQNRDKFIDGCVDRGYGEKLGLELWDIIEPFAGYAFCKAHATAYALIAYWTAYLKANYPAEFIAACIDSFPKDRIPMQADSARSSNIDVFAPDVNRSVGDSITNDSGIYLGFSVIAKNASTDKEIVSERERGGEYTSLGDFISRTRLPKDKVTSLIEAGAFDSLHPSRMLMSESVPAMITEFRKKASVPDELSLFFDEETDSNMIDFSQAWRLEGEEWTPSEKLKREAKSVGFVVGSHPFDVLVAPSFNSMKAQGLIPHEAQPVASAWSLGGGRNAALVGIAVGLENKKSRAGREYASFTLESGNGERDKIECVYFAGQLEHSEVEMQPVVLTGRVTAEAQDNGSIQMKMQVNGVSSIGGEIDDFIEARSDSQKKKPTDENMKPDNIVQQNQEIVFHLEGDEAKSMGVWRDLRKAVVAYGPGRKRVFMKIGDTEAPIVQKTEGWTEWDVTNAHAKMMARAHGVRMSVRPRSD